jgi:hypothetical protein
MLSKTPPACSRGNSDGRLWRIEVVQSCDQRQCHIGRTVKDLSLISIEYHEKLVEQLTEATSVLPDDFTANIGNADYGNASVSRVNAAPDDAVLF